MTVKNHKTNYAINPKMALERKAKGSEMKPSQQETDTETAAAKRILSKGAVYGGPRPSALAWAVDFAQDQRWAAAAQESDPEKGRPSQTEWTLKWEEVKRFAKDAGLGAAPPLTNLRSVWPQLPARFASPYTASRSYTGPGEQDWLIGLHDAARVFLDFYVNEKQARSPELKITLKASMNEPGVMVRAGDYDTGFWYHVFHLLGDCGSRLGRCRYEPCRKLFLKGRRDREFCSGKCQAKQYLLDHPPPKKETDKERENEKRKAARKKST